MASRPDAYHGRTGFEADLDSEYNITTDQSSTMNEDISGNVDPRPAIRNQEIVFSCQTYEKGSNADGVLHFTQPFIKDFYIKK